MSTIDERWNIVQQTRAFCQKVLPLVYDESLSYMEMVCKMSSKLNEIIENNNNLPAYIKELIKEIVNSDDFVQIVGSVLMDTIINVKFPPEGIIPAKGDGVTDDTKSIQDCLNYANEQGGATVFFPSGKYLTNTLSIASETSILGADRYNTSLILKGGGSTPLLQGVISQSIRNIHLDGNRLNQIEENYLIDGDIENALINNVILSDSAHCITSENCNANEFCNVKVEDISDTIFINGTGSNNLMNNINTVYAINITGNNNNWQSAQQTKIENTEALIYQEPQNLSRYFNYITMQYAGDEYKVLVEGDNINSIGNVVSPVVINRIGRFLNERPGFIDDTSNAYGTPQGCCSSDNIFTEALLKTNNDALFKRFNVLTGEVISEKIVPNLGHYSCLFYYNNTILVTNSTNNDFYVLDYDTYNILDSFTLPSSISAQIVSVLRDENNYYVITANAFYVLDLNLNIIKSTIINNISTIQSATLYNDNIYIIYSQPEYVQQIDLQGNFIANYILPEISNNGYFIGELESINFYNGECYLCTFSSSGYRQPLWLNQIFKTNFDHSSPHINTLDKNFNYLSNLDVKVNPTNFVYNPNGTTDAPFNYFGEAIIFMQYNRNYKTVTFMASGCTEYALFNGSLDELTIFGKSAHFKNINITTGSRITIRDVILDDTILPNYNFYSGNIYYSNIVWGNIAFTENYPAINTVYSQLNLITANINYSPAKNYKTRFLMTGSNITSVFAQTFAQSDKYTNSKFLFLQGAYLVEETLEWLEPYNSNPSYFNFTRCEVLVRTYYNDKPYQSQTFILPITGGTITITRADETGVTIGTFYINPTTKEFTRVNQYLLSVNGSLTPSTTNLVSIYAIYGLYSAY